MIIDGVPASEMTRDQIEGHVGRLQAELQRERDERNFYQLERDRIGDNKATLLSSNTMSLLISESFKSKRPNWESQILNYKTLSLELMIFHHPHI